MGINERLHQIPILHARGTHRTVGFIVGRQFRSLIEDVMKQSYYLNTVFIPEYETEEGRQIYDISLKNCTERFPQYVQEIQGMAEGANVPFNKLFLLNIELFVSSSNHSQGVKSGETGCSSIISNCQEVIIGHTEDAGPELLNNVFILSAEIIDGNGEKLEKFSTLVYAGCLPGYTMGFNEHGIVHSVNTLYPLETCNGRIPRNFIARAILGASSSSRVLEILRDKGCGISDAFSLNVYFYHEAGLMWNIEICPDPDSDESKLDVLVVEKGETYAHCNKFLRLDAPQLPRALISSGHRHEAIKRHPKPESVGTVKEILSDRSDVDYPVFRYGDKPQDPSVTVAAGVFDISNLRWNIYVQEPTLSNPIAVIPLQFKTI